MPAKPRRRPPPPPPPRCALPACGLLAVLLAAAAFMYATGDWGPPGGAPPGPPPEAEATAEVREFRRRMGDLLRPSERTDTEDLHASPDNQGPGYYRCVRVRPGGEGPARADRLFEAAVGDWPREGPDAAVQLRSISKACPLPPPPPAPLPGPIVTSPYALFLPPGLSRFDCSVPRPRGSVGEGGGRMGPAACGGRGLAPPKPLQTHRRDRQRDAQGRGTAHRPRPSKRLWRALTPVPHKGPPSVVRGKRHGPIFAPGRPSRTQGPWARGGGGGSGTAGWMGRLGGVGHSAGNGTQGGVPSAVPWH